MKQAETIPLPMQSLHKLENLIGSVVGEIKKDKHNRPCFFK